MKFRILNSYNRKLFFYFFVIFAIFSVAVGVFQFEREKQAKTESLETTLFTYNQMVHNYLKANPSSLTSTGSIISYFPDSNLRITIIKFDGVVIYDSFVEDYEDLENHLYRPEVQEALQSGKSGSRIRFSNSTKRDYYYYAYKYPEYIVRTALPYNIEVKKLLRADNVFIFFIIILFFISSVSLIYVADRMGKAISKLELFAKTAANNEPIDVQVQFPNNELGTIGREIVNIYKSLKKTQNALSNEKEKLIKHLHTSQEGLAIFSKYKKEILANNHFIQFANVIADQQIVWSDEVFGLKEFKPISDFIDVELSKDKKMLDGSVREEMNITKNGRYFQIYCIIFQDKSFEISITDITMREREKILKRELTSNIAHELKTPVSSIRGYLETIVLNENLDRDKQRFFIERSYAQTQRLTDLINDISFLNKIEEASSVFEREKVSIKEVVTNVFLDVHLKLEEKNISYSVDINDDVIMNSNQSLIYSIFRNLVDNAITYAGENISLMASCYRQDERFFYFRFYDTGSGVKEEHLSRLFERFYRVDSGRSRKMGGTGLGLAIVKNAVSLLGGEITVKNRVSGGLEFLFSFKKALQ
ncbi:sensor histidine kinase [Saccharicrinis sp. FJH62]|uniref:sensor histidine kinase n=1 Tax=Saccharicrinis sp. FJH62 TaxID=3344657 RepID=UPI0035D4C561